MANARGRRVSRRANSRRKYGLSSYDPIPNINNGSVSEFMPGYGLSSGTAAAQNRASFGANAGAYGKKGAAASARTRRRQTFNKNRTGPRSTAAESASVFSASPEVMKRTGLNTDRRAAGLSPKRKKIVINPKRTADDIGRGRRGYKTSPVGQKAVNRSARKSTNKTVSNAARMKGIGGAIRRNPGRTALIGSAIAGGAAYAAYRSAQGTGRDINQSLGNPASQITSWTTYNRASRGY